MVCRVFVQKFIQANIKEIIKGLNYCPLWGDCTGDRGSPLTKRGVHDDVINGNIFPVTGHLCGEFTGPGEFPAQRPVTWSFDVFFDLRLNKRLSKQSWGWLFETISRPLWRHCNMQKAFRCHDVIMSLKFTLYDIIIDFVGIYHVVSYGNHGEDLAVNEFVIRCSHFF